MSAVAIAEAVHAGRRTVADSVAEALDACAADRCNAVTAVLAERARARAADMDARGETQGPLAGVPFAVKNIFDVAGLTTRAGSAATDGDPPAKQDAFVIRALEAAGAVLVATTNMDEFAYGFSGENAYDGDTLNPRDRRLSPGGSSSGSAALVASGAVPLALGTDTNGSVRVPAALCGTVGFKPTYGRLSRVGVFPFVPSLDHVGIFAADVADAARAFEAMDRPDPADPVAVRAPQPEVVGPRAARLGGWFARPLYADVAAAIEAACAALGARDTLAFRLAEEARAASFILTTSEGGQTHLKRLAARPETYGPLVAHRLSAGAMTPAIWTTRAQKLRRMACAELADLHAKAEILVAPAAPCPAFPVGTDAHEVAGSVLPIRLGIGMFTQALTLTGVPIVVLSRRGESSGLPVGIQLIAAPQAEATLLAGAAKLEAAGFHIAPEDPERKAAHA